MDVFVFPSQFEGFGIAMLEARQRGCPWLRPTGCRGDGAVVPGHVNFMSLKKSPAAWARKIAELADGWQRTDASAFIREAGLDIVRNAEKLQELYLSQGGEA